jgi:hypothetical protein
MTPWYSHKSRKSRKRGGDGSVVGASLHTELADTTRTPSKAPHTTATPAAATPNAVPGATTTAGATSLPEPLPDTCCTLKSVTTCATHQTIFYKLDETRWAVLHSPTYVGMGYYDQRTFTVWPDEIPPDLATKLTALAAKLAPPADPPTDNTTRLFCSHKSWELELEKIKGTPTSADTKQSGGAPDIMGLFGMFDMIDTVIDIFLPRDTDATFFTDRDKEYLDKKIISTFRIDPINGSLSLMDTVSVWELQTGHEKADTVKMLVKSGTSHTHIFRNDGSAAALIPGGAEIDPAGTYHWRKTNIYASYERVTHESDIYINQIEPHRDALTASTSSRIPHHYATLQIKTVLDSELKTVRETTSYAYPHGIEPQDVEENEPENADYPDNYIIVHMPQQFEDKTKCTEIRLPRRTYVPPTLRKGDAHHPDSTSLVKTVLCFTEFLEDTVTIGTYIGQFGTDVPKPNEIVQQVCKGIYELRRLASIMTLNRKSDTVLYHTKHNKIYHVNFGKCTVVKRNPKSLLPDDESSDDKAEFGLFKLGFWNECVCFLTNISYDAKRFALSAVNPSQSLFHTYYNVLVKTVPKIKGLLDESSFSSWRDALRNYKPDTEETTLQAEAVVAAGGGRKPQRRWSSCRRRAHTTTTTTTTTRQTNRLAAHRRRSKRRRGGGSCGSGRGSGSGRRSRRASQQVMGKGKKTKAVTKDMARVLLEPLGITDTDSLEAGIRQLQSLPISDQNKFVAIANRSMAMHGHTPEEIIRRAYDIASLSPKSVGYGGYALNAVISKYPQIQDSLISIVQIILTIAAWNSYRHPKQRETHERHLRPATGNSQRRVALRAGVPLAMALGMQSLKSTQKAPPPPTIAVAGTGAR